MRRIFHALRFIATSPLNRNREFSSVVRFLKWQFVSRVFGGRLAVDWIDDARLLVKNGEVGLTGNIYCGLAEFDDMAFLLCALRQQDLFIDIGANAGAYTVLASTVVGASSVAFEPVPATYDRLLDQVYLNRIHDKVRCLNVGVGDIQAVLQFTTNADTTNKVSLSASDAHTVAVDVVTLDGMEFPPTEGFVLVKIDVEGFEMNVLKGGRDFFANPRVQAIIIELNGSGSLFGQRDEDIHGLLLEFGLVPADFDGLARTLSMKQGYNDEGNTIYVRDMEALMARCRSAPFHTARTVGDVVF